MAPPPAPVLAPVVRDTISSVAAVPVRRSDSLELARLARDSVLDAAMLDSLAATAAPDSADPGEAPSDAETATVRDMFDIDVANWSDHGRVQYYLKFFTGPGRERMGIWLERMPRYEPTIRTQLISRGLPGDLAYLPLIESGYSATAVSRARAVGMWQFMRATGKFYGLTVDSWVDERRDIVKSTHAAIRYLADLTAKFGSPYLAAAAYNGGPGRIERGLARIDVDEEEADSLSEEGPHAGDAAFFQLADTRFIKRETKDYVPKLIAAAMIAKQPERYGFPAVSRSGIRGHDSVVVNEATGLDVVAKLAGVTLADLWAINPSYLRAVTPPKRRAVVRIPGGTAGNIQETLDAMPAGERLTGFAHHTRKGETLTRIAKRYGLSLATLRNANPELAKRAPRTGEVVRIPGQARLAGWVSEDRRIGGEAGSGATHRVKRGETLGGIAARYRVSLSRLLAWNGLSSKSILRVGQVIRVQAPPKRATPVRSATASARSKVHIVRTGETLSGLARRYGVTLQALRTANSMRADSQLLAGQRLTIPS